MKTKNLWLVVACLLLIAVYVAVYNAGHNAGYKAGENSAELKLREKELVFQKENEKTRKEEFDRLLRLYKEEKEDERREKLMQELDSKIREDEKEAKRLIEKLLQERYKRLD